jgi:DNA-binding NtrC family response regulator
MILWQTVLVNSLLGAVIVLSLLQFTNKRLRFYFVLMCLMVAAYINPVILTAAGLDQNILEILSRTVFFFGALTVISMALFMMVFAKPSVMRKTWFWAVQGLVVVAGLLSLASDWVVSGIDMSGPRPVFGILQPFYQILLGGDFLSALIIFTVVAVRAENSLLRYQMTIVGLTFAAAMILMMTTNLVAPLVTGDHRTARLGPLWLMIPILGIFRVVVHAKKRELFRKSRNFIDQYIEIASSVERILSHENHASIVHFTDDVKIGIKNLHAEPQDHVSNRIPPGIMQGLIADKNRLAYENLQLAVQVERIRQENRELDQEKTLPAFLSKQPQLATTRAFSLAKEATASGVIFAEHIPHLRTVADKNTALYQQEIICISAEFFTLLAQAENYSRSRQSVLIHGETGSGKAVLARSMHFQRTGKKLAEVSCYSSDKHQLRDVIAKYLADDETDKGLLLRNIDYLEAADLMILHPLLSGNNNGYVYCTAKKDFLNLVAAPEEMLSYLNQLILTTVPLRDRPDDIAAQLIWFAQKYADLAKIPHLRISEDFMKTALKHAWPGNSRELITAAQKAVLLNQPPVLDKIQFESLFSDVTDSKFGPLETSERLVIANYLRKNRYNKNRTRIQLGITINTLNAKINKYKIALPKET